MRTLCSTTVATVLLATQFSIAAGQDCSDYAPNDKTLAWKNLQPLVLLTEYIDFGSVKRPLFALYTDGTAIYWNGSGVTGYLTEKLDSAQVTQFLKISHLDDVEPFKNCYTIAGGIDAPASDLFVKTSRGYKDIFLIGNVHYLTQASDVNLPNDLWTAYKAILTFHPEQAHEWKPPYFEVNLWRWKGANPWLPWPADLPNLKEKNTIRYKTKHQDGYFIYIPISNWDEYQSFKKRLGSDQVVLLASKKWAIDARFPFPHEGAPTQAVNSHP